MATRDIAINIINLLSEEQLQSFIVLFKDLVSDIPNEETVAAMQEAEEMLSDPHATKFSSVDDLFAELRS